MKIICTKEEKNKLTACVIEGLCDSIDEETCFTEIPTCIKCFEKFFNIEWEIVNK